MPVIFAIVVVYALVDGFARVVPQIDSGIADFVDVGDKFPSQLVLGQSVDVDWVAVVAMALQLV